MIDEKLSRTIAMIEHIQATQGARIYVGQKITNEDVYRFQSYLRSQGINVTTEKAYAIMRNNQSQPEQTPLSKYENPREYKSMSERLDRIHAYALSFSDNPAASRNLCKVQRDAKRSENISGLASRISGLPALTAS